MPRQEPLRILQIKVVLRYIKPPIWRRILVPSDTALHQLHGILQATMGWMDCHLHQFIVRGVAYGSPDLDIDFDVRDESRVRLRQALPSVGDKIEYQYDFGDGWEHEIIVEKVLPPEEGAQYPVCVKGKRACPPEDCGGIPGYYNLLEALQDPSHPDHEELSEWVGGPFDPEAFELDEVNEALRGVTP